MSAGIPLAPPFAREETLKRQPATAQRLLARGERTGVQMSASDGQATSLFALFYYYCCVLAGKYQNKLLHFALSFSLIGDIWKGNSANLAGLQPPGLPRQHLLLTVRRRSSVGTSCNTPGHLSGSPGPTGLDPGFSGRAVERWGLRKNFPKNQCGAGTDRTRLVRVFS